MFELLGRRNIASAGLFLSSAINGLSRGKPGSGGLDCAFSGTVSECIPGNQILGFSRRACCALDILPCDFAGVEEVFTSVSFEYPNCDPMTTNYRSLSYPITEDG